MLTARPSEPYRGRIFAVLFAALSTVPLAGCSEGTPARATSAESAPPEVGIVTVEQSPRPQIRELPGASPRPGLPNCGRGSPGL